MMGKSIKRRIADAVGRVSGMEIVAAHNAAYWPERRFVVRLLNLLAPDCMFDVGANAGQYGRDLRTLGYEGLILSFEPNPAAFDRLERAASGDPRWHVHRLALGRTNGRLPFNVMHSDVFSSFHAPSGEAGADFADANRISHTVEIEVERLADVLPRLQAEHGFERPFLKMDTQGFDLEVLAGAGAGAKTFCGLLSEVSVRKIYEGAPTMDESLAAFRDRGFVMSALFSVHPRQVLKAVEFNCYCVRDDLADAREVA